MYEYAIDTIGDHGTAIINALRAIRSLDKCQVDGAFLERNSTPLLQFNED